MPVKALEIFTQHTPLSLVSCNASGKGPPPSLSLCFKNPGRQSRYVTRKLNSDTANSHEIIALPHPTLRAKAQKFSIQISLSYNFTKPREEHDYSAPPRHRRLYLYLPPRRTRPSPQARLKPIPQPRPPVPAHVRADGWPAAGKDLIGGTARAEDHRRGDRRAERDPQGVGIL